MAVQDNLKQYNEITNINRTIFLRKWLCTHMKELHSKKIDITTFTKNFKEYITDYTDFNCVCTELEHQVFGINLKIIFGRKIVKPIGFLWF